MEAIISAQAEINSVAAERLVQEALTNNIPPTANCKYKLRVEVFVYSEQRTLCDGPFIAKRTEWEMITVQNKEKTMRKNFNSFQIKPFYSEYEQKLHQFKSCPQYDKCFTEIIQQYEPMAQDFTSAIG